MAKLRMFEVEATVVESSNSRFGEKKFEFEISAPSFEEAIRKAETVALEQYYENDGQGDNPKIVVLRIDGETIN